MPEETLMQRFTGETTRLHESGGATAHELAMEIAKRYAVWGAAIAHSKGKTPSQNELRKNAEGIAQAYRQILIQTRQNRITANAKREHAKLRRRDEPANIVSLLRKHKKIAEGEEKQMAAELEEELNTMGLEKESSLRIQVKQRLGDLRVNEYFGD